jgi:uracil-DNA glycosylase
LTVKHGCPNSHSYVWKKFTDNVIKYISRNTNNVVFVLWGAYALSKKYLIDDEKHKIIVSSHPSGLSYTNKLRNYSAFCDYDHFGIINKYLVEHNKESIVWQL